MSPDVERRLAPQGVSQRTISALQQQLSMPPKMPSVAAMAMSQQPPEVTSPKNYPNIAHALEGKEGAAMRDSSSAIKSLLARKLAMKNTGPTQTFSVPPTDVVSPQKQLLGTQPTVQAVASHQNSTVTDSNKDQTLVAGVNKIPEPTETKSVTESHRHFEAVSTPTSNTICSATNPSASQTTQPVSQPTCASSAAAVVPPTSLERCTTAEWAGDVMRSDQNAHEMNIELQENSGKVEGEPKVTLSPPDPEQLKQLLLQPIAGSKTTDVQQPNTQKPSISNDLPDNGNINTNTIQLPNSLSSNPKGNGLEAQNDNTSSISQQPLNDFTARSKTDSVVNGVHNSKLKDESHKELVNGISTSEENSMSTLHKPNPYDDKDLKAKEIEKKKQMFSQMLDGNTQLAKSGAPLLNGLVNHLGNGDHDLKLPLKDTKVYCVKDARHTGNGKDMLENGYSSSSEEALKGGIKDTPIVNCIVNNKMLDVVQKSNGPVDDKVEPMEVESSANGSDNKGNKELFPAMLNQQRSEQPLPSVLTASMMAPRLPSSHIKTGAVPKPEAGDGQMGNMSIADLIKHNNLSKLHKPESSQPALASSQDPVVSGQPNGSSNNPSLSISQTPAIPLPSSSQATSVQQAGIAEVTPSIPTPAQLQAQLQSATRLQAQLNAPPLAPHPNIRSPTPQSAPNMTAALQGPPTMSTTVASSHVPSFPIPVPVGMPPIQPSPQYPGMVVHRPPRPTQPMPQTVQGALDTGSIIPPQHIANLPPPVIQPTNRPAPSTTATVSPNKRPADDSSAATPAKQPCIPSASNLQTGEFMCEWAGCYS